MKCWVDFFRTAWVCCICVQRTKEAGQWLMPPGGPVALAVLRRGLGLDMFLVLDSRSGELRHLRSWVLKVGSRRDASSVDASGCSAVLAAATACGSGSEQIL